MTYFIRLWQNAINLIKRTFYGGNFVKSVFPEDDIPFIAPQSPVTNCSSRHIIKMRLAMRKPIDIGIRIF
jgi:hypothetical protein